MPKPRHPQPRTRPLPWDDTRATQIIGVGLALLVIGGVARAVAHFTEDRATRLMQERFRHLLHPVEDALELRLRRVVRVRRVGDAEIARRFVEALPPAASWERAEQRRRALERFSRRLPALLRADDEPVTLMINEDLLVRTKASKRREILDRVLIHQAIHAVQHVQAKKLDHPPAKRGYWQARRRQALWRALREGHVRLVEREVVWRGHRNLGPEVDCHERWAEVKEARGGPKAPPVGNAAEERARQAALRLDAMAGMSFVRVLGLRVGLAEVFPYLLRHPPTAEEVFEPIRYLERRGFLQPNEPPSSARRRRALARGEPLVR